MATKSKPKDDSTYILSLIDNINDSLKATSTGLKSMSTQVEILSERIDLIGERSDIQSKSSDELHNIIKSIRARLGI